MTKRDIAALLCKAVSLYIFVGVLNAAPFVLQALTQAGGAMMWIAVVPIAFQALIGIVLWKQSRAVAERMAPQDDAGTALPALGAELQTVAFSAVGLFVTVQAIFRFVAIAINLYVVRQQAALVPQAANYSATPEFTRAAIELAVGLWLLLGTASVVSLVGSIRRGGVDAEHRAPTATSHE